MAPGDCTVEDVKQVMALQLSINFRLVFFVYFGADLSNMLTSQQMITQGTTTSDDISPKPGSPTQAKQVHASLALRPAAFR